MNSPAGIDPATVDAHRSLAVMRCHKSANDSFKLPASFHQNNLPSVFQETNSCNSLCYNLITIFLVGKNKPEEMDPDLFLPIVDHPRLPEKVRTFFRFGVPERGSKPKCNLGETFAKDEENRFLQRDDNENNGHLAKTIEETCC